MFEAKKNVSVEYFWIKLFNYPLIKKNFLIFLTPNLSIVNLMIIFIKYNVYELRICMCGMKHPDFWLIFQVYLSDSPPGVFWLIGLLSPAAFSMSMDKVINSLN